MFHLNSHCSLYYKIFLFFDGFATKRSLSPPHIVTFSHPLITVNLRCDDREPDRTELLLAMSVRCKHPLLGRHSSVLRHTSH